MNPSDTLQLWIAILLMAAGTVAARASFIVGVGRREPGPRVKKMLRAVPAAVLSALVAPAILAAGEGGAVGFSPRLAAGAVAAVVAWRTRNAFLTIGVGMAVLWVLQGVGGRLP